MRQWIKNVLLTEEAMAAALVAAMAVAVVGWGGYELHLRGYENGKAACEVEHHKETTR